MSEWKEYKLGEICSFVKDKISIRDVSAEVYISTENMLPDKGGITQSSSVPLEGMVTRYYSETILISNIRPYFKKIWLAKTEGGCSNDVLCFKGNEVFVNSNFLYYLLSQDAFFEYVMLGSKGCKMPRGDKDHIMKWDVLLPSIEEQRRIAGVLSSLDDKIDLLNRENATLEALAETLFRHYFIENPDPTWKEGKLGDVAILSAGGDKPQIVSSVRTKDTPVPIFSNGIEKDGLYGYTDKARVFEESVTVSARGTIGFVSLRTEPFVPIVRLVTLIPIAPMTSKYMYYWAKSADINGTGTTQQQLTVPDFKKTRLLLPDTNLIQDFTEKANVIYDKIKANQQQMQTLATQRDTLLPQLMSGK
jgi:type I restriction enzyme S subunit